MSWVRDAITIGREVGTIGLEVYRSVRARRRRGDHRPVRIEEIDEDVRDRAAARARLKDARWPES